MVRNVCASSIVHSCQWGGRGRGGSAGIRLVIPRTRSACARPDLFVGLRCRTTVSYSAIILQSDPRADLISRQQHSDGRHHHQHHPLVGLLRVAILFRENLLWRPTRNLSRSIESLLITRREVVLVFLSLVCVEDIVRLRWHFSKAGSCFSFGRTV